MTRQLQRRHGVEPRLSAPAQPQMCDTGRRMHPDGSLFSPAPSSQSPPGLKSLTAQIREREREGERDRQRIPQARGVSAGRRGRRGGGARAAGARQGVCSEKIDMNEVSSTTVVQTVSKRAGFNSNRHRTATPRGAVETRTGAHQGRRGGGCARNACVFSSPFCRT